MSETPEQASRPEPGRESGERILLHGTDPQQRRKRLVGALIVIVLLAAAVGGIVGLIAGRTGGLIAAAVVGLPLLLLTSYSLRRQVWLEGNDLVVRTWGTRRLPVAEATRLDVVITQVRGARTVGLLVGGKRTSVKVDLAVYQGTVPPAAGRELGIVPLRRLANALMNNTEVNGMVFAELLVAQLRAEAKGDGLEGRPLYRLATAAPGDKLAQRYSMQAISRFVASLD